MTPMAPPVPVALARLVIDANRSGALEPDDPDEQLHDQWDARHGAVFLANRDDDDMDGTADAEDGMVNGANDLLDLAPIQVRAWPEAPAGATGTLSVDGAAAGLVRLFRVDGDANDPASYTLVGDDTHVALTLSDLQNGVRFAIEGIDFASSTAPDAWTGFAELSFSVGAPGWTPSTDKARMRVAPLLFQFNTARTERVFHTDAGQDTKTLHDGILSAQLDATTEQLELAQYHLEVDVWAQDFLDLGWTSMPSANGEHGMKIAIRSAQPDRSAGAITDAHFLGPDFGSVWKYDMNGSPSNHSYSMNSFGNWDVIPPYDKGDEHYPLGRNLWGRTEDPAESPDAVYQDFVRAQRVQPEINIDTHWLLVGHVDEFTSWVKTNTPRGWGMLIASPAKARAMLMDLSSKGHGPDKMFDGKMTWAMSGQVPAARAIDDVLKDPELMAASQMAQMNIDADRAKLQKEIGLDDSEITEMPFLIDMSYGAGLAYQPGTVNLLHVDGKVVIPDPFGPVIQGSDPFKQDLMNRLGALGLEVHFADDWDTFHEGDGEVHCGTNVIRNLQLAWWETGR
jgi:protein-arginine deiminase